MTLSNALRSFSSAADARAAGYSTIAWLRAFTHAEHQARIAREAEARQRDFIL